MSIKNINDVSDKLHKFYEAGNKNTSKVWWIAIKLSPKAKTVAFLEDDQKETGLDGLKECLKANDSSIIWAAQRIQTKDDEGSVRQKYLLVKYIGENVGVMEKAKLMGMQSLEKAFELKHYTAKGVDTADLDDEDKGELVMKNISRNLLKSGGGHKPNTMSGGPNNTIAL